MLLDKFEPKHVIKHLERICEIPHISNHEGELCRYIKGVAAENGHTYYEDEAGNLIVYVKATAGCEDVPAFLMQAHMDMVAAKVDGSDHNFLTDSISLRLEDGRYLYADGTTLGADNAVGMMNMLALMEDKTVVHPALELLFTVCEENGLIGIRKVDFSKISARRMINMDCGDPDVMCVSTAGAAQCLVKLPVTFTEIPETAALIEINVGGLLGGHAGLMIDQGHYSAVTAMGRILHGLGSRVLYNVVYVNCSRISGIAAEMKAVVAVRDDKVQDAREAISQAEKKIKSEYADSEPGFFVSVREHEGSEYDQMADDRSSKKAASLLYLMPYGVIKRDWKEKETIFFSNNAMEVSFQEVCMQMDMMVRAPEDLAKEDAVARIGALADLCGAALTVTDSFAGWPYRSDSPLQDLCHETYFELTGEKLKVEKHNSCAETGVIAGAIPEMDIVALAPLGRGAHTPAEHLDMDTVEPFWQFLVQLLKKMCRGESVLR